MRKKEEKSKLSVLWFFVVVCFVFCSDKLHLQVEKHNFIIYKVIISKTKLYGNNNDRVEYSVSCNGCNSNDGVKEVLKC